MTNGNDKKVRMNKSHVLKQNLVQEQLKKAELYDEIEGNRLIRYKYNRGLSKEKEEPAPFHKSNQEDPY